MTIALSKSKILNVRPVCQDKCDGGQLRFLQTFLAALPNGNELLFFGRKMNDGRMRQEAIFADVLRKAVATGNLTINGNDVYIVPNTLASTENRQKDNVGHLIAFFTDIDYAKLKKHRNKRPEEVAAEILEQCRQHKMPLPSFIVYTGHGLHVWWVLQNPVDSRFIHVWDEIQLSIHSEFHSFGADARARDAVRFLRVPGTTNAKEKDKPVRVATVFANQNRKYVSFDAMYRWAARRHKAMWLHSIRCSVAELTEAVPLHLVNNLIETGKIEVPEKNPFIPFIECKPIEGIFLPTLERPIQKREREAETAEECSRRHQVKALSVNPMRLRDLQTLVKLRGGKLTGCRELLLYHFHNTLMRCGFDIKEQARRIGELNNQFTEPLPKCEIKSILNQRKLYMARNATIIRDLDITPQEQVAMQTIFDTAERERRRVLRNKCQTSNDERVKKMCAEIMKHLALGCSNREIAIIIGCTARTVRNYIHKFDLLGKGAVFCAGEISGKEDKEQVRAAESAAKAFATAAVDSLKSKVGVALKRHAYKLGKKEKAQLISQLIRILEQQIPDYWQKIKDVADRFYKEADARLLRRSSKGKISYTCLFRELISEVIPGLSTQNRLNGLATAFMAALYAV